MADGQETYILLDGFSTRPSSFAPFTYLRLFKMSEELPWRVVRFVWIQIVLPVLQTGTSSQSVSKTTTQNYSMEELKKVRDEEERLKSKQEMKNEKVSAPRFCMALYRCRTIRLFDNGSP